MPLETFEQSIPWLQIYHPEEKFGNSRWGNFFYCKTRDFASSQKLTRMKIWILQKCWYILVDNHKWWLHANFQPPKSKEDRFIAIFLNKIKIPFPPLKTCYGPYRPGGCLRPKLLPPLGIPWALVSNPLINRISIFWSPRHISKSSQNSTLK